MSAACKYAEMEEREVWQTSAETIREAMYGYYCDCGCGAYWRPTFRFVEGPAMLSAR